MQASDDSSNGMPFSERVTLFIGGISANFTEEQLIKELKPICKVYDVRLMRLNGQTITRGFGFISVSVDDYKKLTEKEIRIEGKRVDIKLAKSKNQIKKDNEEVTTKRLFVGGLSIKLTEDKFRKFFSKFGELKLGYIVRESNYKKSRGFGFLEYVDPKVTAYVLKKRFFNMTDGNNVEVKSLMEKDMHMTKKKKNDIKASENCYDYTCVEMQNYQQNHKNYNNYSTPNEYSPSHSQSQYNNYGDYNDFSSCYQHSQYYNPDYNNYYDSNQDYYTYNECYDYYNNGQYNMYSENAYGYGGKAYYGDQSLSQDYQSYYSGDNYLGVSRLRS